MADDPMNISQISLSVRIFLSGRGGASDIEEGEGEAAWFCTFLCVHKLNRFAFHFRSFTKVLGV